MGLNHKDIINELHLLDLGKKDSPTVYIKEKNYQILTLKFVSVGEEELGDDSNSYYITEDNQIYYVDDKHQFEKFNSLAEFYRELQKILSFNISIVKHYMDEIDKLEDELFDKKRIRYFMEFWFKLKKDLSKLERVFERWGDVFFEMNKNNIQFWNEMRTEFLDLQEDIGLYKRIVKTQLSKLDNLYSYHSSIRNDHLNKNIYIFTLISGIFLPLNLIVGFFGMNTSDMFYSKHPKGTEIVMVGLIIIFFVLFLGLPILRVLDRFLLSHFFGNVKFYVKMSHKLQRWADDFDILKR